MRAVANIYTPGPKYSNCSRWKKLLSCRVGSHTFQPILTFLISGHSEAGASSFNLNSFQWQESNGKKFQKVIDLRNITTNYIYSIIFIRIMRRWLHGIINQLHEFEQIEWWDGSLVCSNMAHSQTKLSDCATK